MTTTDSYSLESCCPSPPPSTLAALEPSSARLGFDPWVLAIHVIDVAMAAVLFWDSRRNFLSVFEMLVIAYAYCFDSCVQFRTTRPHAHALSTVANPQPPYPAASTAGAQPPRARCAGMRSNRHCEGWRGRWPAWRFCKIRGVTCARWQSSLLQSKTINCEKHENNLAWFPHPVTHLHEAEDWARAHKTKATALIYIYIVLEDSYCESCHHRGWPISIIISTSSPPPPPSSYIISIFMKVLSI